MSDILGTNEIAPLDMAAAFAGIANNGVFCAPIAIDRIVDSSGNEIPVPKADCRPAVSPEVAATMAFALTSVVTGGTATASNPRNGIPHFGKTGTTDFDRHTWFIGASSNLATAVWVGNVDGLVPIRSTVIGGTNGGSVRHNVWRQYTTIADAKYGGDAFAAPNQAMVRGVQLPVPNVTGLTLAEARTAIEANGFEFADGGPTPSAAEPGTIERTSPSGTATRGALITVFYSDGSLAEPEREEIDDDDSPPVQVTPRPTPRPTPPADRSGLGLGLLG
jgi:membrane peptidoglycan carboxypeptidase